MHRYGEDAMIDEPQETVVDYFRKSCGTLMRATEDRGT
jgi:hypothetical protein